MKLFLLALFFSAIQFLSAHRINIDLRPQLILWNVGQGQWLTYIKNNYCYHMDMGGEFNPKNKVLKYCRFKKNWIYISHADRDHINFYKNFTQQVEHHCLVNPNPNFFKFTKVNKKNVTLCPSKHNSPIATIYNPQLKMTKNRNELSKVFIIENKILNPGDSLNKNERYWAKKEELKYIRVLILGHHGSLTSNSDFLLKKLPNLKYSLASARKKRYGHPHGRISLKLKLNKTPVLSTEHWADIFIRF